MSDDGYCYSMKVGDRRVEVSRHGFIVGWIDPETGHLEKIVTERESDAMLDAILRKRKDKKDG